MSYFSEFQKLGYDIKGTGNRFDFQPITNILQRVRMKADFLKNRVYYSDYSVLDGETPESLAFDFYGNSGLHWIILYAQQITNPYYDWPMTYYDLNKFVQSKYGINNVNENHHWEDDEGNWVNEPGTPIGNGTTDVYPVGAVKITNLIHEERENDKRRLINIIRPEYVNGIRKEFESLLELP